MKELGQYLKSERKKQGLTIEELADRTKIHIQKLQFIEEGNKEALPAKVFCIGLIKSYARELKVDLIRVDELCLAAFTDDEATPPPVTNEVSENKPAQSEKNSSSTQAIGSFNIPRPLIITASIALTLVLLFTIFQLIEKMNSYSEEENLAQDIFISSDEPLLESKEDKSINETEKVESTKEDIVENIKPKETPEKPAPKIKTKDKEPALEVAKTESPLPVTQKTRKKIEPTKKDDEIDDDFSDDNFDDFAEKETSRVTSDNKLTIKALEPVRAEVIWSDGFVQVMLLKGSETKTLVFSKPITLRVNNGGAVQVTFNNTQAKVPGTFNKPIEIKYP